MIGHTTLVTLCGFAYGMKGFYIASTASVFGSALSFTILRLLFSKRLREWSGKSDKWQALESVVVCSFFDPFTTSLTHCLAENEGPPVNHPRSSVPSSTMGLFKLPLCGKRSHQDSTPHFRIYRLHTPTVDRGCVFMAIRHSDFVRLSEAGSACFHRFKNCSPRRR